MTDTLAVEPAIAETKPDDATGKADANPVENSSAESAPAAPETSAVPERDKVQERFDKLTREKYDALRTADTERYQRERLQERLAALEAKTQPVAPVVPTLEGVGYDESKYQSALIEFAKAQARAETQAILEKDRNERNAAEKRQVFETRQNDFIKSKPDYAEKVLGNTSLPITPDMAKVIMESDLGPQVAYYLADNEDKARAIAQLDPLSVAREIGRIEARLEAAKVPPKPPVSQAPPPAPKLDATDAGVEKDPATMSDNEFAKWRKRQIAQR